MRGLIPDYLQGITRRGTCAECKHGADPVTGCRCSAAWCPCHRATYGHGGHTCDGKPASHRG
jgi:hypothetical protein